MADAASAVDFIYGSLKIVPTYKIDGSTIYLGSYSIFLDRYGCETNRTGNSWTLTINNVPGTCLPLLAHCERIEE